MTDTQTVAHLPLTTRHDLERLGIDTARVVEATSDATVLRFTHDQLTAAAERAEQREEAITRHCPSGYCFAEDSL